MEIDECQQYKLKDKKATDHNTINVTLKIPMHEMTKKNKMGIREKVNITQSTNWSMYRAKLNQNDIINRISCSVNKYDTFIEELKQVISDKVGYKTSTNKQIKNKELRRIRIKRKQAKRLYHKAIKENWPNAQELKKKYINLQKEARNIVEKDYITKVEKTIGDLTDKENQKSNLATNLVWKIKRQLNKSNKDQFTAVKDEQGRRITDPQTAANIHAAYYEKLYRTRPPEKDVIGWIHHVTETVKIYKTIKVYENDYINRRISLQEVKRAIKQLKPNKTTGPDNIPNAVILQGRGQMEIMLLYIINHIMETERIPQEWKDAEIISLYKGKGDTESMANKRGITLASNIGKLFERILNNRLIATLKFTDRHAGGRKERSTVDQLYLLKSIIEQANRSKKKLYITFIDIEKAYDKTWLDAVLYMLWNNKIRGKIWRLIKEINSNLTAKCRVCNT